MRNRFALWRMYGKMYRAGKRTVRKMLRKGANPYLKMLSDLLDEGLIEYGGYGYKEQQKKNYSI